MCIFCEAGNGLSFSNSLYHDNAGNTVGFARDEAGSTGTQQTGSQYIDGVISSSRWATNTLTYSFPDAANDFESSYGTSDNEPGKADLTQISAVQQQAVRSILEGRAGTTFRYGSYEAVTQLNVSEAAANSGAGDIRLTQITGPSTAYAYYPYSTGVGGDVWFGTNYNYKNPVAGNYAWLTHIHELGHAFGLKHAHDTSGWGAVPADRDGMEFTVMSYKSYVGQTSSGYTNESFGYAQTLMMYDIAALQKMYGANYGTNGGDTTYTFNTATGEMSLNGVGQGTPGANRVFLTVWDGGGTDTYDLSNYTTNLQVDLTPGGWTNLGTQRASLGGGNTARGNIFNALEYNDDERSLIDNANAGSGNDLLVGNDAANVLMGNAGADTLRGGAGRDTLFGGLGADDLSGGTGDDMIYGNQGTDIIRVGAGDGSDSLWGGQDADLVDASAADAGQVIYGNLGNDDLRGGSAADLINGGHGADTIVGGGGADTIVGGRDDDRLTGGAGADLFVMSRGLDNGQDTITDFNATQGDRLSFSGQAYTVADTTAGLRFDLGSAGAVLLAGVHGNAGAGWFA